MSYRNLLITDPTSQDYSKIDPAYIPVSDTPIVVKNRSQITYYNNEQFSHDNAPASNSLLTPFVPPEGEQNTCSLQLLLTIASPNTNLLPTTAPYYKYQVIGSLKIVFDQASYINIDKDYSTLGATIGFFNSSNNDFYSGDIFNINNNLTSHCESVVSNDGNTHTFIFNIDYTDVPVSYTHLTLPTKA